MPAVETVRFVHPNAAAYWTVQEPGENELTHATRAPRSLRFTLVRCSPPLAGSFAFEDDDMGLMFWLYHFVLLMIPIGCDIIWWTTGITPSNWWYVEGSTVPITWLLQRETALYHSAFKQFTLFLLPGCIMFLVLVALKRRGVKNLGELNRLMRRSASKGEASFESQF